MVSALCAYRQCKSGGISCKLSSCSSYLLCLEARVLPHNFGFPPSLKSTYLTIYTHANVHMLVWRLILVLVAKFIKKYQCIPAPPVKVEILLFSGIPFYSRDSIYSWEFPSILGYSFYSWEFPFILQNSLLFSGIPFYSRNSFYSWEFPFILGNSLLCLGILFYSREFQCIKYLNNKTSAQAFTPPAKNKMGTKRTFMYMQLLRQWQT